MEQTNEAPCVSEEVRKEVESLVGGIFGQAERLSKEVGKLYAYLCEIDAEPDDAVFDIVDSLKDGEATPEEVVETVCQVIADQAG